MLVVEINPRSTGIEREELAVRPQRRVRSVPTNQVGERGRSVRSIGLQLGIEFVRLRKEQWCVHARVRGKGGTRRSELSVGRLTYSGLRPTRKVTGRPPMTSFHPSRSMEAGLQSRTAPRNTQGTLTLGNSTETSSFEKTWCFIACLLILERTRSGNFTDMSSRKNTWWFIVDS